MSRFMNAVRVLFGGKDIAEESPYGAAPMHGVSTAGQSVNDSTMMQLSAVSACVRLISQSISTLPLVVYDRAGNYPRPTQNHWLHSILSVEPSAGITPSMLWESLISAALINGQGYAEELYVGDRLVGLEYLPYQRLALVKNNAGETVWRYADGMGGYRDIPRRRVFKLTGFTLDGVNGVSAVQYGASVFGSALAANEAAANTFKNGLLPTVAFEFPHIVPEAQRENFKAMTRRHAGALNAGDPVVLEGGMRASSIGINPGDAQLLESRQFSIEEICRWFGVPPDMIGHTGNTSAWGTGIEQRSIALATYTFRPWIKRIEEAITIQLMPPGERGRYQVKYDLDELLRTDLAARANFQSTMVNNGLRTRDELRVKDGLPPMGGNAGALTIQSAMMPIDQLGRPV